MERRQVGCRDSSSNTFWNHFWVLLKGSKAKELGTTLWTYFQLPHLPDLVVDDFSENELSWKLWENGCCAECLCYRLT